MDLELKLEQEAELERLYQDSVRKFADRWVAKLYDRLDREKPSLMSQIDAARGALDDVWIAVRHGRAGIEDFKRALQEWELLHLKVINHEQF